MPTSFRGIVGQKPHRPDPEILEDLDADAIVALVGLEAEALVGFDGIEPLILKLVGADLVGQADAAPFLIEVEQDAAALGLDLSERRFELQAAVAPRGVEHVAGQAARVHPHQHVRRRRRYPP